jgi:hypothetical protein
MILTKLRLVILLLITGLLAVGAVLAGTDPGSASDQPLKAKVGDRKGVAGGPKDPPPANAEDADGPLKKVMLEDARKVFALDLDRYRAGVGPLVVEELYLWSVRGLEAELDLVTDVAGKTVAKAGQGRERDAVAARYYSAKAELWVTRGRMK